jgi:hypothetical protein
MSRPPSDFGTLKNVTSCVKLRTEPRRREYADKLRRGPRHYGVHGGFRKSNMGILTRDRASHDFRKQKCVVNPDTVQRGGHV